MWTNKELLEKPKHKKELREDESRDRLGKGLCQQPGWTGLGASKVSLPVDLRSLPTDPL